MDRRTLIAGLSAALSAPPALARAEPGNVATAFAAALTAHDLDAFAALFADDYVNHQTSAAAPPPPEGLTPKQATLRYFAARLTALPDLTVTADPVLVMGDQVAANFTYSGTHQAAWYGVAASGRRITFNSCDILLVRDGRIAAHWGAVDLAGLLKQLRG